MLTIISIFWCFVTCFSWNFKLLKHPAMPANPPISSSSVEQLSFLSLDSELLVDVICWVLQRLQHIFSWISELPMCIISKLRNISSQWYKRSYYIYSSKTFFMLIHLLVHFIQEKENNRKTMQWKCQNQPGKKKKKSRWNEKLKGPGNCILTSLKS